MMTSMEFGRVMLILGLMATSRAAFGREDGPPDPHSASRPDRVRVGHLVLDLDVVFDSRTLGGAATWTVERLPGAPEDAPLILDTEGLTIRSVEAGASPLALAPTEYRMGETDPILGTPLEIQLPAGAAFVRIGYETSPTASALQWVEPAGTAGKKHPFLFSQAQAIHARSFVPCQDSPGVRITYDARLSVPPGLKAVMAAEAVDDHTFRMANPIPSYLIALAVGDLEFRDLGPRTGIWAEPATIEAAAWEFADTEAMLIEAERLFGPYRWGRYDILVLPPSFPYGGMENPRLTFATPTVLAGDRSQVDLIAHEMAHSWSGNLVTNATWRDFWLNEGFTVYLQRRIVEAVYGTERADMDSVLGLGELQAQLTKLPEADTILAIDLDGRDPEEGVTPVPYEKGALFLATLETKVGRERLIAFLKGYFDHFAFQSITTEDFEAYLRETLFEGGDPPLNLVAWLHRPGIPEGAAQPASPQFAAIEALAKRWAAGEIAAADLPIADWATPQWLHFLRSLPDDLPAAKLAELDDTAHLTETGNAEIATQWLVMAIHAGYRPADARLEKFLTSVGRRKFLMPLYEALKNSPGGLDRARAIFAEARPGYHPIAVASVAKLLEVP